MYHIICFDKRKIAYHNMAGGFDGMGVTDGAPEPSHPTAQGMV